MSHGGTSVEEHIRELTDMYGIQAGILRRQGKRDAALRSYEAGRVYANLSTRDTCTSTQGALLLWLHGDHAENDSELYSKIKRATHALEERLYTHRGIKQRRSLSGLL